MEEKISIEELEKKANDLIDKKIKLRGKEKIELLQQVSKRRQELFRKYGINKIQEQLEQLVGCFSEKEIVKGFVNSSKSPCDDELNSELVNYVERYIPKRINGHRITDTEKAICIYHILCKVLYYDKHIDSEAYETYDLHQQNTKISDITPKYNEVICDDFAKIYSLFLEKYGICHEIKYCGQAMKNFISLLNLQDVIKIAPQYHKFCVVKANNVTFSADPFSIMGFDIDFHGDKKNAYYGIRSLASKNKMAGKRFNKTVDRVLEYMNGIKFELPTQHIIDAIKNLEDKKESLSPSQKSEIALEILQEIKINDATETDKMQNTKKLVKLADGKIEFLKGKKSDETQPRHMIGLIKMPCTNKYYLYNPSNSIIKECSLEKIGELFDSGTIEPYQDRKEKSSFLEEVILDLVSHEQGTLKDNQIKKINNLLSLIKGKIEYVRENGKITLGEIYYMHKNASGSGSPRYYIYNPACGSITPVDGAYAYKLKNQQTVSDNTCPNQSSENYDEYDM